MGCRSSKVLHEKDDQKRTSKARPPGTQFSNPKSASGAPNKGGFARTKLTNNATVYPAATTWGNADSCDDNQHHQTAQGGASGGATYGGDYSNGGGSGDHGSRGGGGDYSDGRGGYSGGGGGGDISCSSNF